TYYPNINIPGESTREAQTHVILKNGDTLVIGGLIREMKSKTESKIPFLGDLPFIGQLFRTKTDETDKRELIIFITAKVIER
ncbi:MAG: type IV pilus secretin PilQ, partial [Brevinematales bacterium]